MRRADRSCWTMLTAVRTCDYGSLTNEFNDPKDLWKDSQAAAAFANAKQAYEDEKSDKAFVEYVAPS